MKDVVQRYSQGFGFIISGTRLILVTPGLKKWAVIPFLINLMLLIFGLTWGVGQLGEWTGQAVDLFLNKESWFYDWLYFPLLMIFGVAYIVLLLYGLFLIATVIASPFNSILAEQVLMAKGVIPERPFHLMRWIRTSVRMLIISLIRSLIMALFGVFIFIASFVPVVNLAASFAAFLIIAFDSMDYSMEIMEMGLKERFAYFKKHFVDFSGMATFLGLTLFIPGLTLLLLPSSVVGAANLMALSKQKSGGRGEPGTHP